MFNVLFGLHVAQAFGAVSDVICFNESISANATSDISLLDAMNGTTQNNELKSKDYIITSILTQSSNGQVKITILPDAESKNKIKFSATTTRFKITPNIPILMTTGLDIKLENQTEISEDVEIHINCIKLPQTNTPALYDYATTIGESLPNVDIQTLGTQTFIQFSNMLLAAINAANNGIVQEPPPNVSGATTLLQDKSQKEITCGRV